jgi:hypothetical protein
VPDALFEIMHTVVQSGNMSLALFTAEYMFDLFSEFRNKQKIQNKIDRTVGQEGK